MVKNFFIDFLQKKKDFFIETHKKVRSAEQKRERN